MRTKDHQQRENSTYRLGQKREDRRLTSRVTGQCAEKPITWQYQASFMYITLSSSQARRSSMYVTLVCTCNPRNGRRGSDPMSQRTTYCVRRELWECQQQNPSSWKWDGTGPGSSAATYKGSSRTGIVILFPHGCMVTESQSECSEAISVDPAGVLDKGTRAGPTSNNDGCVCVCFLFSFPLLAVRPYVAIGMTYTHCNAP